MKRLGILMIAVILLLSGCGVIRETKQQVEYVPVSTFSLKQESDAFRVQKSAVYFYNDQSKTLTAEIRSLFIGQDENPAKAAIELLLEGPFESSDLIGTAPEGTELSFIEYSRETANVYLRYSGAEMDPQQKYLFEIAVANTVTDLLEAKYVSIFYNGVYTGFSGTASEPLIKRTGSISEAYNQATAKYIGVIEPELPEEEDAEEASTQDEPKTQEELDEEINAGAEQILEPVQRDLMTVLYFASEDGAFILPEVRDITYTGDNFVETILGELMAGPNDTGAMKSFFPQGLELMTPPVVEEDRVSLSFNKLPVTDEYSDEDYQISYAALVYTLTGFMPNVKTVDITVAGQPITDFYDNSKLLDGMQRDDYRGFIGSSAPLYLQDKNSDLLLKVQRSMEQSKIWSPKHRLYEIIRGPLSSNTASIWPPMLTGITVDDILSVKTYDDMVVVDLSQNFKDICDGRSARTEMILVYSMVNTLTAMDGINKVQFLVEGKQTDTLSGTLCISDPFLMNYGIIKK